LWDNMQNVTSIFCTFKIYHNIIYIYIYINIYIYKLLMFNMYYKDFKYAENVLHRKYFANT